MEMDKIPWENNIEGKRAKNHLSLATLEMQPEQIQWISKRESQRQTEQVEKGMGGKQDNVCEQPF